jgi:hypothetical protein
MCGFIIDTIHQDDSPFFFSNQSHRKYGEKKVAVNVEGNIEELMDEHLFWMHRSSSSQQASVTRNSSCIKSIKWR